MEDPDNECMKALDAWVKAQKEPIYEQNFKGPSNGPEVLYNYRAELGNLCAALRRAIWANETTELERLGWSPQLIECTRDPNMRLEICDRLKEWLITFPSVKHEKHLDILLGEQ